MATAMVGVAFSVVGKALAPLADGLLKNWAASMELGDNMEALERELKLVKALLEPTVGREIDNSSLRGLLEELKELGYDADDVLDELDYFRIQDELDGTFHAANKHAKGVTHNLALNLHHTAKAVGKQIWLPACFSSPTTSGTKVNRGEVNRNKAKLNSRSCCNPIYAVGKCFHSSSLPSDLDNADDDDDSRMINSPERNHVDETLKLTFDRVDASRRMQYITEQLRRVREDVSNTVRTLGYNWSTTVKQSTVLSRPITTSESIELKLYGRDLVMNNIIHDITKGKYSADVLTVIPIIGPGGIGKTTLAQHIHNNLEVQDHFDVRVWTCVSLNFNVNKLIEEILRHIPKIDGESSNGTASELIGQRLKNKRLLLVLDDIWDCNDEDDWKQLLVPFQKSQVKGNTIIVTTRFPSQAQIMVRKNDQSIYLQGLENTEFEKLFLQIIFGDDDQSRKDHTFLLETGFRIVSRLKGSPLAAKTVGRLLKTKLDLVHWTRILESKEWEHSNGKNDIMPALKLSFDHLPPELQQCFTYCALFPQDYIFKTEQLINFWIGQDFLRSSHGENKRVEDIGLRYLTELVNYGFLENKGEKDGRTCYIIHDLLHELARKMSSLECLSIDTSQSQVSSLQVLPSIRHLSINIDGTNIKDRITIKNCVEDFNTLDTRLKVEKLRTLMIFGQHQACFVKAFSDLFREAKGIRVILLSNASYGVEYLLCNFYNLLHLRYLHIESSFLYPVKFPNKISRFYHMMVLDATHCDNIIELPRDMSNLAKLRHFLVRNDATHSSIVGVGKLKSLQELRRFVVKREGQGFDLREIGHLVDLCGSLSIYSLENVQVKEEVDDAKLLQKSRLHELTLHWGNIDQSTSDTTLEEHVLERLKPNSNILKLSVKGHRGSTCPSWLGSNLSVRNLESLCLEGIDWKKFPPIGELLLVNLPHEENISGGIPDRMFGNLRQLELCKLTMVEKWAVHAPCRLFPFLEVLNIKDCPQLVELSFQHFGCCQQGKEVNANLFPRLTELKITNCPQLSSFPPIPWNEATCSTKIEGTRSLDKLVYDKENSYEYSLTIEGNNDTTNSMFWNVLDFHNLTGLRKLRMRSCKSPPLCYLQMLSSLSILQIYCSSNSFPFVEADNYVKYQFPVERLVIDYWNASGKELTQLLTYFPKLSDLHLYRLEKVTRLDAMGRQHGAKTPGPSPSSSAETPAQAEGEEAEHDILFLPPHLQELLIQKCPKLRLLGSKDGRAGEGGGIQALTSLRRLDIFLFPKVPFSEFKKKEVPRIFSAVGMHTALPLSNLTTLTSLHLFRCGDLRGEGLLSLLVQGHLTTLFIKDTPNFFVDSEPPWVHEQELPSRSSKLQKLTIDDVAGFTAAPIRHSLIFSALTKLGIFKVESFTEEQVALLFVDSLEDVSFSLCDNLQSLPGRLHRLPNLKRLGIWSCNAIQMLPKDCLPDSLQKLEITLCPAIRSLPKVDDLPSSLREIDVSRGNSEELRTHCRKFINIIPIVKA